MAQDTQKHEVKQIILWGTLTVTVEGDADPLLYFEYHDAPECGEEVLDMAEWFVNRGCRVTFSPYERLNWLEKLVTWLGCKFLVWKCAQRYDIT